MTGRIRVAGTLLTALVLTFGFALPVAAGNPNQTGDYVYQERSPKPLKNAKRTVLQGTRNADGTCHYEYPEITVGAAGSVIEVRDMGSTQRNAESSSSKASPAKC